MHDSITLGNWSTQSAAARQVRETVFIIEQNVPRELEWDEMDPHCIHALAFDAAGQAIGTGRLLPDGHIGRMAVLQSARGTGVGARLLSALMDAARARGDAVLVLSAQIHAAPFYRRFGFQAEGEEYMEAGIPHVTMRLELGG